MVEPETDLLEVQRLHRRAEIRLRIAVEEQEPAATRADELATERPGLQPRVDPPVDAAVHGAGRAFVLQLPLLGQGGAEGREISVPQGIGRVVAGLADA